MIQIIQGRFSNNTENLGTSGKRQKRQELEEVGKSSGDSGGKKTAAPGGATSLLSPAPAGPGAERGMAEETRRLGGCSFEPSSRGFKPTQGEKEGELAPFT